jgi:hypothetical protein
MEGVGCALASSRTSARRGTAWLGTRGLLTALQLGAQLCFCLGRYNLAHIPRSALRRLQYENNVIRFARKVRQTV